MDKKEDVIEVLQSLAEQVKNYEIIDFSTRIHGTPSLDMEEKDTKTLVFTITYK